MPRTKITANPNPKAVFNVLDTAKNEHIPKKYERIKFSMKAAFINTFNNSMLYNFLGDVN